MASTSATIQKLEDRYPFNTEELEVLVRCHERMINQKGPNDFVMALAKALPFSVFFLPGDELQDRVTCIETNILPLGFSSRLHSVINADSFVGIANQGESICLERLIEGIAITGGRRGNKEALRAVYDILEDSVTSEGLIDLCVRLGVASQALTIPQLQEERVLSFVEDARPCIERMAKSLDTVCKKEELSKNIWVDWAEKSFPSLSRTLSTFVHNLVFHGHPYPPTWIPYCRPEVPDSSAIFESDTSPLLLSLSFMASTFGGKWHRLYSSDADGFSFNRLEWALLGYTGPTVTLIKTTKKSVLGAYTTVPWKDSKDFSVDFGSFLFQLEPNVCVFPPEGGEENMAYLHTSNRSPLMPDDGSDVPRGLGFGGSLNQPRLFIPESLDGCTAGFFDKTYQTGSLLPEDALEKFDISVIEIWSVNGGEEIQQALHNQAKYRDRHQEYLREARIVHDKSEFVKDFETGLFETALYEHRRHTRGREDFRVDEAHGGYALDRE